VALQRLPLHCRPPEHRRRLLPLPLLWERLDTSRLSPCGCGAIGAAVFTLDIPGIHGLFALAAFIFFNLEAIAGSTLVRGPLRAIAVIAGVVGLIFLVTHAASDFGIMELYGPIGHGGSERMIVYPALFWLAAFGGYLMAPATSSRSP
jgi:hypothetical protein